MKKVTLDKTTLTIDEKTSGYINITNGNGWYSVTRNNANVSVHPNGSTGYRVYGEKVWSSILNIKDSAGKVVSVSVVVRENPIRDVMKSYEILQTMANNGFWNDGYINEYKWKTRAQIEVQAKIFAEKLFNYKMTYDTTFRNEYNAEVNTQVSKWWVKSDIEKWLKDWVIEWTKDYLMSYYDTVKNLSNLSFESVSNGVSSVWNIIKNPVGTLTTVANSFQELYNIFLNIWEIVSWLESYKKGYYPSYLWTNFWLSLIPAGKLNKVLNNNKSTTIKDIIWTSHGYKHFPPKWATLKDLVKISQSWPAKYINWIDVKNFEIDAWNTWQKVTNWKDWKVKKYDNFIGASDWKESKWIRIENSAWTIHWHPISENEYLQLIK